MLRQSGAAAGDWVQGPQQYNPKMANKGRGLEEIIKYTNLRYEYAGIALVQKVSTPWIVIRNGKNIVSAFPEGKSTLDFKGTIMGGIPVSFDAKETKESGLPLGIIEEHQIEYIRKALSFGEISFIVCEIKPLNRYYIAKGSTVVEKYDLWQKNKGKRGYNKIPVECMEELKPAGTAVLDYVSVVKRWMEDGDSSRS